MNSAHVYLIVGAMVVLLFVAVIFLLTVFSSILLVER